MTNDNSAKAMKDPLKVQKSTVRISHNASPQDLIKGTWMDLHVDGITIEEKDLQYPFSVTFWFFKGIPNCLSTDCIEAAIIEVITPYLSKSFSTINKMRVQHQWIWIGYDKEEGKYSEQIMQMISQWRPVPHKEVERRFIQVFAGALSETVNEGAFAARFRPKAEVVKALTDFDPRDPAEVAATKRHRDQALHYNTP